MKFTCGLLTGVAIGATVMHYLNSREGQALVNKIKDDANDVGEKVSELTDGLIKKGRSLIGNEGEQNEGIVEETVVLIVPNQ